MSVPLDKFKMAVAAVCAAWGLLFARVMAGASLPGTAILIAIILLLLAAVLLTLASGREGRIRVSLITVTILVAAGTIVFEQAHTGQAALENKWQKSESNLVNSTLLSVGEKITDLQHLSRETGNRAREIFLETAGSAGEDSLSLRLELFRSLKTLATEIEENEAIPEGTEIGIQIFDSSGTRVTWAGWPQGLSSKDAGFLAGGRELIFSRQVSLYRMLTCVLPVMGGDGNHVATVVVDVPLEVNYRVNNKFIKGRNIANGIVSPLAGSLEFEYYPTAFDLPRRASSFRQDGSPETFEWLTAFAGDQSLGLNRRARLNSLFGNPLLTVSVRGRPFRHFSENHVTSLTIWTKACLFIAFIILFFLAFTRIPRKENRIIDLLKTAVFIAFLVISRYALLQFQTIAPGGRMKVFDPVIFATPFMKGLMRSAGDLLITSVFFLIAVYGVLKIARGVIQSEETEDEGSQRGLFIFKGLMSAAILFAVFELSRRFINTVVVNANPRLVGSGVNLFESHIIVLHLAVFLAVTGIFLAGMLTVWGAYRVRGRGDIGKASVLAALLLIGTSVFTQSWEVGVVTLLLLLLIHFSPRFVQREDLVSIVIGAFFLVLLVTATSYVSFNSEYQELKKIFTQEKSFEIANPSDNWKVFILEDILENLSRHTTVQNALRDPTNEDIQRLGFDLWAESPLSLLGYSCAIYVVNGVDSVVSRFAVDMPFRVRFSDGEERMDTPLGRKWAVMDLTKNTSEGIVRFYRGIVTIDDFSMKVDGRIGRNLLGRIIIDIPFFFKNLSWAARTGPRTPEILRNVQEGGIEPRLEEPEALLLARLKRSFVLESSTDDMPAGIHLPEEHLDRAKALRWPLLGVGKQSYRIMADTTQGADEILLAGFKVPSPLWHGLRWATLLSLYLLFTFFILVSIVFLKRFPPFQNLLPTLTPGQSMGFQQKLLVSFLIVAVLPAIILGVFSTRLIEERFVEESKKEALSKAFGAKKALLNLIGEEFSIVTGSTNINALIAGEADEGLFIARNRAIIVFAEGEGEVTYSPDEIYLVEDEDDDYLGKFSRSYTVEEEGGVVNYYVYYGRRLDGELLAEVAEQVGADVNVYETGALTMSSREGLLAGGFISSVMNADAFAKVCMLGVDHFLATERAGSYSYQVAYLPLEVAGTTKHAALGLPLLFRPESYHVEVQKATFVVMGVFALLFVATIGLGLFLARGIFEPLKDLVEGTKRISRGDLSFKLPMDRRDEIGTVVEAFNEMTDKLSQSQAALEERRQYLETILVNIGTGVISTDSTGMIRTLNNAAEKILGIESRAAQGKTLRELAEDSPAASVFETLDVVRLSERSFVSSEIVMNRDGKKSTIKYMHTKLTVDDQYLGAVFVFEDLTELISTQKLAAWVEMARQIAHEIKNPLTPIRLSTQFMMKAYNEKSPEFEKIFMESSDTIIQQVDVLKKIAGEFSSFGRMQQLAIKHLKLAPLIQDIITPYRKNASGVEVSIHLTSLDTVVMIDPEALRKVCTNLVENALEAMPQGGKLQVTSEDTTINGESFVKLSFRDTGPGLSGELKEKLFEPYFSTKTTGTGLGLAICRSLSREMGGDVIIDNLPDGSGAEAVVFIKKEV